MLTQLNICVSVLMLQTLRDNIMTDTVILGSSTFPPLPDHTNSCTGHTIVADLGSTLLACMSTRRSSTMQVVCSA